jgi:hypothetical protein
MQSGRSVKMIPHLLVRRLRMPEAMSPCSHTLLWRERDKFTLLLVPLFCPVSMAVDVCSVFMKHALG